jgi:hypothetical protein
MAILEQQEVNNNKVYNLYRLYKCPNNIPKHITHMDHLLAT